MRRARLLRRRPRPPCPVGREATAPTIVRLRGPRHGPRTPPSESTPRVLPSGAASQLDPSHRSSPAFLRQAANTVRAVVMALLLLPAAAAAEVAIQAYALPAGGGPHDVAVGT